MLIKYKNKPLCFRKSRINIAIISFMLSISPIISLGSDFNPGANLFNTASVMTSGALGSLPINSTPSNAVERSGSVLRDVGAVALPRAGTALSNSIARDGAMTSESNARPAQGNALNQANSTFNVTSAPTSYTDSTNVAYQTASVIEATEAPAVPELPKTGGGGRARK